MLGRIGRIRATRGEHTNDISLNEEFCLNRHKICNNCRIFPFSYIIHCVSKIKAFLDCSHRPIPM